jgi:hypothetical protein
MYKITVCYNGTIAEFYENCPVYRIVESGYFMFIDEDKGIHYIPPHNIYDIKVEQE